MTNEIEQENEWTTASVVIHVRTKKADNKHEFGVYEVVCSEASKDPELCFQSTADSDELEATIGKVALRAIVALAGIRKSN